MSVLNNNVDIKKLLFCKDCHSQLHSYTIKKTNKFINCRTCKKFYLINKNSVLLSNNQFNKSVLANNIYSEEFNIELYKSKYISFVEENQTNFKNSKTHNLISFCKQIVNLSYYVIVFWGIFLYFLFFKKKNNYDNMTNNLINELSKTYAYVPEMAIWKFIEIIRVKKSIPQKKINCVLDIGGGNGIVFSKLKNFFDFQF